MRVMLWRRTSELTSSSYMRLVRRQTRPSGNGQPGFADVAQQSSSRCGIHMLSEVHELRQTPASASLPSERRRIGKLLRSKLCGSLLQLAHDLALPLQRRLALRA
jgi:hypothetical protein